MTQFGMVARKVTNGATKEAAIHIKAVTKMVATEAFPEMATHPTDSPYVVFGHPPKNAPTMEPTPSPSRVL